MLTASTRWLDKGYEKIEVELSSTSGGVFITKWSRAPLSHCTNVPLIAHISCSVSCIELKLGTNDDEGITQQII